MIKAKENYLFVKKNYPETDYAIDSSFKLDLINDILASKEMYIGLYYIERKKWIPAINRFRNVIDDYSTTMYVEEALHRLVEIYYLLGLKQEAQKYASLLGYNYKSSKWYEKTYILFNKTYDDKNKKIISNSNKENSVITKIKSLFE